ncbi:MAG: hypothetical protein ABJN96_11745 [Marinomonas sp.]
MAYPASEMIANTIAEAINTADNMGFWDYVSVGGAVAAGIGGIATAGLLIWEISKSRKERARIRSIATLQKIERQHEKIISFLLKNNLPNNTPTQWGNAYIELLKLTSIDSIETQEIREEAQSKRNAFIEELKLILIDGDPEKQSLRWQFFTGITDWQTNDNEWKEINKEANIGSAFAQADRFGNYDKKDSINSLSPLHALAVYHFIYTGQCPKIDSIEFPTSQNKPKNKTEFTQQIKIDGVTAEWLLNDPGNKLNGLIHYLFEFYQQTDN